jgi:NTE family protein
MRTTTDSDLTGLEFFERVELFAGFPQALREQLLPVFTLVRVPAGEWLFRQGDPGDALLIVQSGRLEVVLDSPDGPRRAGLIGPGGVLGELALLLGGVRTASVRALRESELLRLDKGAFDELFQTVPAFAFSVSRALARQLQLAMPPTVARPREVAVVAVIGITPQAPAAELSDALCQALTRWGTATQVLPPEDRFDQAQMGRSVAALEGTTDTVLMLAPDRADSQGWARFCLRQADVVIAVVDPRSPAAYGPDPELAGCEIVFWTPSATGSVLVPWLDRLQPAAHHLVSPQTQGEDVARLARRLTGHSLGLVLSGGGARGLAHIGVLRAFTQAGYTIDRVGGTSMGSLIGGLFALGLHPDDIASRCRAELVDKNPFNDYTLPRHALIKARKATDMLGRLFRDGRVENTRRSLFTMSADLVTGQEVVHRRGPIMNAVGASMCLPGLAPPIVDGIRLLVDGGVLNNLPVDVMAARDEGPIVAVDVRQRDSASSSGAAIPVPTMVDTLGRACVLGSWLKTDQTRLLAALVIAPDLPGVGLLDFRQFVRAVEEGQRAAEIALATCSSLGGL